MKSPIILTIAVLVSITFLTYSYIKANEAERNAQEAMEQTQLARSETLRAEKLAIQAQESATEAREAQADAERSMDLLLECQNGR